MTSASVNPRVEALVAQLGYTSYALKINVADLGHDDSLVQPQPGGNCLNWIVGHLVSTRNGILAMLGREATWTDERAERYARSSDPIVDTAQDAFPLDELLAAFDEAQQEILDGLEALTDEDLEVLVPWFGEDVPKAVALAGLVFHEAYHVGQTGLLRRIAGKAGAIG